MAVTSYGPRTSRIQASIRDPEKGPEPYLLPLTPNPKVASPERWREGDGRS